MVNTIQVPGLGEIVEVSEDFTQILSQLNRYNAGLISPRDEAYARIQTADKERVGRSQGTWTRAGFEYVKGELPILVRDSRLLNPELATQAVKANRLGKYFTTGSTREYEESLTIAREDENKDPKDRRAIVLPSGNKLELGLNDSVLQFLLQDQTERYYNFNGGNSIGFYLVNQLSLSKKETTLTQLWFRYLDYRSDLNGNYSNLDFNDQTRGVRLAEGDAQKSLDCKVVETDIVPDIRTETVEHLPNGLIRVGGHIYTPRN